jgi:hypothetical protein
VGFVVDKVALGQVFSEYFGFPCHSSFHQTPSLSISRGRYNRPEVADVPSGLSMDSTPHYANLKKPLNLPPSTVWRLCLQAQKTKAE